MAHTPWLVTDRLTQELVIKGFYAVRESNLPAVAYVGDRRDAAFIVKAVNCHDELLTALKLLWAEVEGSGNATAQDFGWPVARFATIQAIKSAEGQ